MRNKSNYDPLIPPEIDQEYFQQCLKEVTDYYKDGRPISPIEDNIPTKYNFLEKAVIYTTAVFIISYLFGLILML